MRMRIGDKIVTRFCGKIVLGVITGKHGEADYYSVKLETGEVIYRWAADMDVLKKKG